MEKEGDTRSPADVKPSFLKWGEKKEEEISNTDPKLDDGLVSFSSGAIRLEDPGDVTLRDSQGSNMTSPM